MPNEPSTTLAEAAAAAQARIPGLLAKLAAAQAAHLFWSKERSSAARTEQAIKDADSLCAELAGLMAIIIAAGEEPRTRNFHVEEIRGTQYLCSGPSKPEHLVYIQDGQIPPELAAEGYQTPDQDYWLLFAMDLPKLLDPFDNK